MSFTKVGSIDEIEPGTGKEVTVELSLIHI